MRYVISYDLNNKPIEAYTRLRDRLESFGAKRVLWSQWVVRWDNTSATGILNIMSAYIAPDDRMMVTGLDDGDWNVYNPITHPDTV